MKHLAVFLTTLIAMAGPAFAAVSPKPVLIPANFNKIYIPDGFDSNDNIEFVGEGIFPNTCYRPVVAKVRINKLSQEIFVGPVAYEYPGPCLQMLLPFHRTVMVGILPAGVWKVIRESDKIQLGALTVTKALTTQPDEFSYASVSQAFIKQDAGAIQVLLTGNFLSSCMSLQEVRIRSKNDTIVIQPIVQVEVRPGCVTGQFPFKTWSAIDFLKKQRYLLHVRSINGNAINSLVDVE